jgi:hypothetical protein
LFLRTYTCFVYSSLQESQWSCPEALLSNFIRGGRRVDVMLTPVKEAQGILNLVPQPRGQCIATTLEAVCILIRK